jgi:hypothetical protein
MAIQLGPQQREPLASQDPAVGLGDQLGLPLRARLSGGGRPERVEALKGLGRFVRREGHRGGVTLS